MVMRNICIGLMLCLAMAWVVAAAPLPAVGQMAPAVALPSQDGGTVDLKSFRGKDEKPADREPPDDTSNPTVNFHGEKRSNDTHESKTV